MFARLHRLYHDAIHGTNRDVNNTNAAVGSSSSDDDDDFDHKGSIQLIFESRMRLYEDEILRTNNLLKEVQKPYHQSQWKLEARRMDDEIA